MTNRTDIYLMAQPMQKTEDALQTQPITKVYQDQPSETLMVSATAFLRRMAK